MIDVESRDLNFLQRRQTMEQLQEKINELEKKIVSIEARIELEEKILELVKEEINKKAKEIGFGKKELARANLELELATKTPEGAEKALKKAQNSIKVYEKEGRKNDKLYKEALEEATKLPPDLMKLQTAKAGIFWKRREEALRLMRAQFEEAEAIRKLMERPSESKTTKKEHQNNEQRLEKLKIELRALKNALLVQESSILRWRCDLRDAEADKITLLNNEIEARLKELAPSQQDSKEAVAQPTDKGTWVPIGKSGAEALIRDADPKAIVGRAGSETQRHHESFLIECARTRPSTR